MQGAGGRREKGGSRSQDPNVRDPRNGSILDMIRVECLKMDLQMGTPRKNHSGERWGWVGEGGRVKCRGGGYRVKEE